MEDLIKITENDGQSVVSARELHAFLESKQDFSTWIKNRIKKYGFVENEDYVRLHKKMEANNATSIEYALTLDTAKELAMVEANEKGRRARRYFIDQEKKLRNVEQKTLAPQVQNINAPSVNINVPQMIHAVTDSAVLRVIDYLESIGVIQVQEDPPDKYYSVTDYIREVRQIKRFFSKWDILEISRECKNKCESLGITVINRPSEKWKNGINTYPEFVLTIILNDFLKNNPD